MILTTFFVMYIPEEMQKENAFVDVAIPTNKSFFSRFGEMKPEQLQYSGDEVIPEPMRKVDSVADYEAYAEMMSKEESAK